MAQVLPAERDLRRVIGDADGAGDRQVEGLGEQELLELYRSMVQLRTYDERSVVYHSQGRIGTYAIFWNHEAMQAGSAHALADEDWIFPSYRESAIGLLCEMPPATVLSWWRGHPAGWWNPEDYRVASICVRCDARSTRGGPRVGKKLKGERAAAIVFWRRSDVGRRVSRRRELRGGHRRTARPVLQQQRLGDLDACRGADPGGDARRQGGRLRDARGARRRHRCPRLLRGDARSGGARAER
jgi:hypothetical protein